MAYTMTYRYIIKDIFDRGSYCRIGGGVVYNYHLVIIVHSSDRLLSRGGRNNNQHDIDVYLLRFYFQFHWTM